jgi:hypothetical protein
MDLMRGSCDKEYHTIRVVDPHVGPKRAPRAIVLKAWAFDTEATYFTHIPGQYVAK